MKKKFMLIGVLLIIFTAPIFAESKFSVGVKASKLVYGTNESFVNYVSGQTGDTPSEILNTLFVPDVFTCVGVTTGYEMGILQADVRVFGYTSDLTDLATSSTVGVQLPLSIVDLGVSAGTLMSFNGSLSLFILKSNLDINLDPIVIKSEFSTMTTYDNILSNPYTDYDLIEWGISVLYRF